MDRKNDILKATAYCFMKYGYDKTTLDDIAKQVGINKASFYYYFKNKEAIFVELVTQEADEYIASLNAKVASVNGCRNKILTWIKEGFKYNDTNSILHQISFETLKKLTPQLNKLNIDTQKRGIEFLNSILEKHKKRGEINRCDTHQVAETIHNIVYAMKDQFYKNNAPFSKDITKTGNLVDQIIYAVSLILDGIEK